MGMLGKAIIILCILGLLFVSTSWSAIVYDGSEGLPQSQHWILQGSPPFAGTVYNMQNNAVYLKSGPEGISEPSSAVFYTDASMNPNMGELNRALGFNVSFTLKIDKEEHQNNYAGYAVCVCSSDYQGVELGFWETKIRSYGQIDEAVLISTTDWRTYDLNIQGDLYSLSTGGTQILSGQLYQIIVAANSMFFGDDVGGCWSESNLASVEVTPEPTTLLLLGLGGLALRRRTR